MGRQRHAVPGPDAAALRSDGPNALTKRRVRGGLRLGQATRRGRQPSSDRRPDRGGLLLAGQRREPVRAIFEQLAERRTWTSPRARGCSRWGTWPVPTDRSPAGTTSTTGTSSGRSRRSASPAPTATRRPSPTRGGRRCSVPPRRSCPPVPRAPVGPHVHQRRSRGDPEGLLRTDQVSFHATSAISVRTTGSSTVLPGAQGDHRRRVWSGIHFRTADVQGHVIGRKVAPTCKSTTSIRLLHLPECSAAALQGPHSRRRSSARTATTSPAARPVGT